MDEQEQPYRSRYQYTDCKRVQIGLCYDESCNLACRSCRAHMQTKPSGNPRKLDIIHKEIITSLAFVKNVNPGNGELFFSKYYQDIYYNHFISDGANLLTNGTLFTPENWKKLSKRHKNIELSISADAATKETYAYLRGGTLHQAERFFDNLDFAGQLRKEGHLKSLSIMFVIQKDNYHEMEDFVRLASSIGADAAGFNRLYNWGAYSEEEFDEIDVCDPKNTHYTEVLDILNRPIFLTDSPKLLFVDKEFQATILAYREENRDNK